MVEQLLFSRVMRGSSAVNLWFPLLLICISWVWRVLVITSCICSSVLFYAASMSLRSSSKMSKILLLLKSLPGSEALLFGCRSSEESMVMSEFLSACTISVSSIVVFIVILALSCSHCIVSLCCCFGMSSLCSTVSRCYGFFSLGVC